MDSRSIPYWSLSIAELVQRLQTTPQGLRSEEARSRFFEHGANLLTPPKRSDALKLLLAQFKSPIILILIFAAGLSFFLHDSADALIILIIVLASGLLGFWQERGAANVVEKLLTMVRINSTALRDGHPKEIPLEEIVPGDVVTLKAGDSVPGDGLLLDSKDLFLNEAALTGETYPIEKSQGIFPPETALARRTNALYLGTHVVSGTALAVVVRTGKDTEFGKVSERLKLKPPETEFERGVRRFGYLLMEVTLILVIAIFAINVFLKRPVMDSFLFALALAVGLTPQLLPAIISVNLAHGAKRMALQRVIVKRLAAIENFGSMNVLCSDKTGTLTQGIVQLHAALDAEGQASDKVLLFAYINAFYETGFANPVDHAIRIHQPFDVSAFQKLDEEPYDFVRKRLSILVSKEGAHWMVTKGALPNVLSACSSVESPDGSILRLEDFGERIQRQFESLSSQGYRVLGVAYRNVGSDSQITKDHERDMVFLGFLVFFDPPKPGVVDTIRQLADLGISLKMITGDNRWVAATTGWQIGLSHPRILTGRDLGAMSDEALLTQVNGVDMFAEVEPNQKERIILALKKAGNVAGYMGDGINDASALHSADVGISVEGAVDVAKEAADIVLLDKDLDVLVRGVAEGRRTFANTLKYVFMATSANFGNMFSMAGASLFLPFLPMLPKQILLTNLLTDFPEMTIAMDNVDREMVERPRRWDIRFIRNFMLTFGTVSSLFDYLTFGVLFFILHATPDQFRTGWFIESVVSASAIVLVIRSRRTFFQSMPGRYLLVATFLIIAVTLILPLTPLSKGFDFSPLPPSFLLFMGIIVLLYIATAEIAKRAFYKKSKSRG
jgi:P-type Mg2+ transporter